MRFTPLSIRARTLAVGPTASTEGALAAIFAGSPSFAVPTSFQLPFPTVASELPVPESGEGTRISRILRLTLADAQPAIADAIARFGPSRVAIVVGTCTGGLDSTECAYGALTPGGEPPPGYNFERDHLLGRVRDEVAQMTGAQGLSQVVSTACSSSAKAVLVAQRWVHFGLADAVILIGVDTLCQTTLHGFASLGALSAQPCRPFDVARDGITLAEGGACLVVDGDGSRAPSSGGNGAPTITILGGGESSDAHHQTAPDPAGTGALAAMQRALAAAEISVHELVSINAHGTATPQNDASESLAIAALCNESATQSLSLPQGAQPEAVAPLLVTSTKGVTGHLLGAAGLAEVVIAAASLERRLTPPTANTKTPVPGILLAGSESVQMPEGLTALLSNSFGFGGSNASIVVSSAPIGTSSTVPKGAPLAVSILADAFFSPNYASVADYLAGVSREPVLPAFSLVPGRQRRFTSLVTQMHIEAVDQALRAAGVSPASVPSVFASVLGELETTVEILDAIHQGRPVSPARFAQSVHNTPSGIFSVATKNLAPSTSLAGHASLFADAMLEGMLAVLTLGVPVVVSVADEALPQIFRGSAPSPFPSHAYAVVLGPRPSTHLRGGPPPDLRPEPGDSPTFHTVPTLAALNAICTFAHALGGRKKSRVSGLGGGFDLLLQHADDGPSLHLVAANAAEGGTAASHEGNHAH